MTIHLPEDPESSPRAEVPGGDFAGPDDAMAGEATPDPVLGSMRDAVEEIDGIVADAMKQRQAPWRSIVVESGPTRS